MAWKRIVAALLAVGMLVSAAPMTWAAEDGAGQSSAVFEIGALSSDVISGGGRMARSSEGLCTIDDTGRLLLGEEQLASGSLSCLNALDDTLYYIRSDKTAEIVRFSLSKREETTVADLGERSVSQMYCVNGTDFYLLSDGDVLLYDAQGGTLSTLRAGENIRSFAPTPYGLIYATGSLFHYDIYADGTKVFSDADGYYTELSLNGGVLVCSQCSESVQAPLDELFSGTVRFTPFTGFATVSTEELFADFEAPEETDEPAAETASDTRSTVRAAGYRSTLSAGVQNIVKRAYQMTNIEWTPLANVTGWNSGVTYQAGVTYTGLPYGQPVYASYVPWSTSLEGFIAAVNNASSKMYTEQSTYNKVAPYYSVDCSAFVSWAWNLSSRQTTTTIPNFATLISSTTYTGLQVGDCFCNPGSHVVLVTDVVRDSNNTIIAVEISESTVNRATNYCCQKTWYGTGYTYSLANLQSKYPGGGYSLYRSNTRDNATYTHSCVVPLEGDSCSVCGYGSYTSTPVYAAVTPHSGAVIYAAPSTDASHAGTATATQQTVTASAVSEGQDWYRLDSGWIRAAEADFVSYLSSVQISNASFPSGKLQYGKSFPIVGDVTSINPIVQITGAIYNGTDTSGTPRMSKTVTLSDTYAYTLRSSAIDNALTFGSLPEGQYTFVIEVTERASIAGQSAQTLTYRQSSVFTEGTSTSGGIVSAHGIDVSHHQGTIDWDTVAQNVDFVILRCGYGSDLTSQDDRQWANNVAACERLNIPYGVYLYSYATTEDMARSEAQHVIRLLTGHHPSLPVYYDLEDSNTTGTLTNAQILNLATIFCNAIAAAGYTPGVYSMTSWWNNKLTSSTYNTWSKWVAQFASTNTYSGSYDMWQYSDSGSVSGISGNVDMDYWYADYPTVGHTHTLTAFAAQDATCTQRGNIAYWYCAGCGKYFSDAGGSTEITQAQTQTAALGHNYSETIIPATCLQYAGTQYTCTRCGDTYTTYASGDWSDWSTTRPTGIDETRIESRTEYRYRDYQTTTSTSSTKTGWENIGSYWERTGGGTQDYVASWPGGFLTTNSLYTTYHKAAITNSETETAKTTVTGSETIGYIYWHWCRGDYAYGPINRKTSTTQTSEFDTFHALYSTTAPSNYPAASDDSYNNPNAATCTDTYWYYAIPVTRQSYETFQKIYSFGRWGSWSSWSTEPETATDTHEVETRTVYRYVTSPLGEHSWDGGAVTVQPNCTNTGIRTYTCTVCGLTRIETIPVTGVHDYDANDVCTVCGVVRGATSLTVGGRYVLVTQEGNEDATLHVTTYELTGISTTATKYGEGAAYSGTPQGIYVLTVTAGSEPGTYAFRHGTNSYLAWSSGNSLKTVSTVTANSSWTVTFDGDGNATIQNAADSSRTIYWNASDPRFACYTGTTNKPVKLLPWSGVCTHSETTQTVVEPTCTQSGSITTYCSDCGELLSEDTTPALGHLWGEWAVSQAATCQDDGVQARACTRCSATQTETIPATGEHSYISGVCSVCGAAAPRFVRASAITAGDRIIFVFPGDGSNEPTAAGAIAGSGSSTYLSAVPVTLEGSVATSDNALIFDVVNGSAQGTFGFESRGCLLSAKEAASGSNYVSLTLTAVGADTDWTVTFADGYADPDYTASLSETGRHLRYNTAASRFSAYVSGQQPIMIYKIAADPLSCSHGETTTVTVNPTCTADGVQTVTCALCGTVVSTQTLTALGHDYAYTVTDAPTLTAAGTLTGACSRCGDTQTVTLPALSQTDYTYAVTQASTCTAQGTGRYTWNVQTYGAVGFDVALELAAHRYTATVTPPTCTAAGYTTHTCSVCGDSYVDSETPATGHTYVNGVCSVCHAQAENYVLVTNAAELQPGDHIIFVYPGDATHEPKAAGGITGSGSKTYLSAVDVELSYNTAVTGSAAAFTVGQGSASGSLTFALNGSHLTPSTSDSGNNYVYLEETPADWTVSVTDGVATVHSGNRDLKYYYSATSSHFTTYLSGQKDIAIYKLINCAHTNTATSTAPATCTDSGLSRVVCQSCGRILSETLLPATGHSYASAVTQPTCTAQGYTTYTCSACGGSYVSDYTDALGHSYAAVATQPTCTAQGYTTYTCSRCGDSYVDDYVDAAGHTFVNGTCSVCGATAPNYVLASSIQAGDQIIFVFPGNTTKVFDPHAAGAVTSTSSSTSFLNGVDVTITGNRAEASNALEFTVAAGEGENSFAFLHNGQYLFGESGNTKVYLRNDAAYWTVTFNADGTATVYNGARYLRYTEASNTTPRFNMYGSTTYPIQIYRLGLDPATCPHTNLVTETVAATCTADGSSKQVCPDCGTVFSTTVLPALGHDDCYTVTAEPTAAAAGVLSGVCSRCGDTTSVTLPKLTETDYTLTVLTPATCVAEGTARYTWNNTQYGTYAFTAVIPMGAHSYVDTVVAPTCTEQGYTRHVCSVCGDSYADTWLPANGHSYENFVCMVCDEPAPNFVLADTIAAGDRILIVYPGDASHDPAAAGALTGSGQSAYLAAADVELQYNAAASGAALEFTVEAGENGTWRFKYGDRYLAPVVNGSNEYVNAVALAETPTDWTVSIEDGVASITFDGRALRYNTGSPRFLAYSAAGTAKDPSLYKFIDCSHAATTQQQTAAAACTAAGTANIVCTVCGRIFGEVQLPALGHDYAASVTEPTCTEAGFTTHTCLRCGDSYTDTPVAALGHDYAAETVVPTCTEAGYTAYTCTRCGDSYTDTPVDALGHDYAATVTAPTCTEAGFTTHTCTRCGDSYTDTPVAAPGHDYDADGVCTVCGAKAPNYVRTDTLQAGDRIVFVFAGDGTHEPRAAGVQGGSGSSTYLTAVDVQLVDDRAFTSQALVFTVGTGSGANTYTFLAEGGYLTASTTANAVSLQAEAAEWTVTFDNGVPTIHNGTRDLQYYSSTPRFNAYENAYKSVLIYRLGVDPENCTHEHPQTVTVDATCTQDGSQTVTCPDCGTVLSTTVIPALGHDYVYAVTTAPTLTAQGKIRGTCSRCGSTTALISIPRLNDTENYTHTVTQAATCTAVGSERYALTGADYEAYGIVIELEIPMTPHNYVNGVCADCGVTAQNYLLTNALAVGDRIIFVYPGDATHEPKAAGSISGTSSSAHLNATPAELLHNAVATSGATEFTVEAGATEGSYRFKYGDNYLVPGLTSTGNYANGVMLKPDPVDWTVQFENGLATIVSVSSELRTLRYNATSEYFAAYVSTTNQKLIAIYHLVECEHTASHETVVTNASCTAAGLAQTVCDSCGRIISEREIPALGHDYSAAVTAPTCTASGYTTHTCSRCGDSYVSDETAALGHSYGAYTSNNDGTHSRTCGTCGGVDTQSCTYEDVVTPPTASEQGYTTHTCTVCGYSYVDSYTSVTGCTVSFTANGAAYGTPVVAASGTTVALPTGLPAIGGYSFVGWVEVDTNGEVETAAYYTDSYTVQADVTLKALYTRTEQGTGTQTVWQRVTDVTTVTAGEYALITTDGYAFNGTIGSGSGDNGRGKPTAAVFSFDANGVAASAPEGTCVLTLTAVAGGFTMYNADHGYLYAAGTSVGNLRWQETETSSWAAFTNSSNKTAWRYNANNAYLRTVNSTHYFSTYSSISQSELYLAKKVTLTGSTTYYTTRITAAPQEDAALVYDQVGFSVEGVIKAQFAVYGWNHTSPAYDSYYMIITHHKADGTEETSEPIPMDPNVVSGYTIYVGYYDVYATYMTDDLDVTVYGMSGSETFAGPATTTSVREIAADAIRSSAASAPARATVYANMLAYGAQAQLKFNYNTDDLANALTGEDLTAYNAAVTTGDPAYVELAETETTPAGMGTEKVTVFTRGLSVEERVYLQFGLYFGSYDVDDFTVDLKIGTRSVAVTDDNLVPIDPNYPGYYALIVDSIDAVEGQTPVTLTVYEGQTPVSKTYIDTIENLAATKQGDDALLSSRLVNFYRSITALLSN